MGIDQIDRDLSEGLVLRDPDLLVLHELQNDQEGHNDLFLAVLNFQHLPEVRVGMIGQVSSDIEFLVGNADLFPLDFAKAAADGVHSVFLSLKDVRKYIPKALQRPVSDQFLVVDRRHIAFDFLGEVLRAKIAEAGVPSLLLEFLRHTLVELVLKKPLHQFIPGVLFLSVFVLLPGKEHPALDVEERRGHDQELTGHVHVVMFHPADIFQVLVRDRHDRNVIDIYLILFDQMHKKVHRTFKHL